MPDCCQTLMPRVRRGLAMGALAALSLLAGCASTYRMDNTVQSFSSLSAVPAQAGYRYERLPSQMNDPAQPRLEAVADGALARAGLRRDDSSPAFTVQVWNRMQYAVSPWAQPRWGDGAAGAGVRIRGRAWAWVSAFRSAASTAPGTSVRLV